MLLIPSDLHVKLFDPCLSALEVITTMRYTNRRILYFTLLVQLPLSSSQILLPRYLMNGLNSFDKTDMEYSLALTDDLVRCWRSKIKGQGHIFVQVCGGEGIHVDAGASKHLLQLLVCLLCIIDLVNWLNVVDRLCQTSRTSLQKCPWSQ